VGVAMFDARTTALICVAMSYLMKDEAVYAGACYLACWFVLRMLQRVKAEAILEKVTVIA